MLRVAHCLDNRLIDGGKVVSPTHRPHFTPQKHYFFVSGTHDPYNRPWGYEMSRIPYSVDIRFTDGETVLPAGSALLPTKIPSSLFC
jgi:hypothetical protein